MADTLSPEHQIARRRRLATAAAVLVVILVTMVIGIRQWTTSELPALPEPERPEVFPKGNGITRTVASPAEWTAAMTAAQPGDVIRLTATINSRLIYRDDVGGSSGTEAEPIVITADPGVWIDPGNQSNNVGALDLAGVRHVHVVGVGVRNSQFGIRCNDCKGTAAAPVRIASNAVTAIGHSGIIIQGRGGSFIPSDHILVENNTVSYTGAQAPEFGEGVYIGYGSVGWVDLTSNVTVRNNEIAYVGAEAVDVKPGTRNITIESNLIHDLAPIWGGAISAHYVGPGAPNPNPAELDLVTIRRNKIWNQNLAGVANANDWAIWIGHGGVDVIENTIWGFRSDPNRTRAIRVRGLEDFGPHPINIRDNVFWTARGWMAENQPSGLGNVVASGNRGPDASTNEIVVSASDFVGPVPALGVGSTANAGSGPGSAFALVGAPPATTTTAPAPTTTAPAPTTLPPYTLQTGSTVLERGDSVPTDPGPDEPVVTDSAPPVSGLDDPSQQPGSTTSSPASRPDPDPTESTVGDQVSAGTAGADDDDQADDDRAEDDQAEDHDLLPPAGDGTSGDGTDSAEGPGSDELAVEVLAEPDPSGDRAGLGTVAAVLFGGLVLAGAMLAARRVGGRPSP